ncbi:DUF6745 domain-containing protein [Actinoallomurus sp. CA-142502]|uniref:DUF6745 domain-containing protein n=1 Tax=Actinoallomurus sp. CA-142502 TaxID=3239885 RepID=UPI003D92E9B6
MPARSCGWWWPRERVCVVSDRPVSLSTEVWQDNGNVRLHDPDGRAGRASAGRRCLRRGWSRCAIRPAAIRTRWSPRRAPAAGPAWGPTRTG